MPKLPTNMVRRKDREGYWFRGVLGGRVSQVALGTDYREAIRRLRSLKTQRPSVTDATFRAAAEQWLAGHCATRRTAKGQRLAAQRMADFVLPHLGHLKLHRVTGEDVRAFRLWLERSSKLALTTISHILSDVRSLLNWAEDAGLVDRTPFPRGIMPRLQERPPDRLTDEEASRLRELPEPHGFACRLALGTGLRWGELVRARASDVERGFLVVSQTKSARVRRVPLVPELLAEVRTRIGRLVPFAECSPGSFARAVRRATGIGRFHVHQTRHTFACQALERGVSLPSVQQVLGHAEISTTQRYARLTDDVVMRELLGAGVTQSSPSTSAKQANSLWPRSSDG